MKKILAFVMCFVVMLVCFCGCDAKNNDVSSESDSAESSETNSTTSDSAESSETDSTTQGDNGYFHTYEGEPLAHKKYTIYSTPESGVKEGIANDPATEIIAVKDVREFTFGFVSDSHEAKKQLTYYTTKTEYDRLDDISYSIDGVEYVLEHVITSVVTEVHILYGQEHTFTNHIDFYEACNDEGDALYKIGIVRESGKIAQFVNLQGVISDAVISKAEAKQKILSYAATWVGEDALKEYNFENIEAYEETRGTGKTVGYSISAKLNIDGYDIFSYARVGIYADGTLKCVEFNPFYERETYKKVFETLGKPAIDKAKAVLESAVDLKDAKCYLCFDTEGTPYYLAERNTSYPGCDCWGVHGIHYAVEILPIE